MASVKIETGAGRPRPHALKREPSKADTLIDSLRRSDPGLALAHAVREYGAPGLAASELARRWARAAEIADSLVASKPEA